MIQSLLLGALITLCVLLIISLIRTPFDQRVKNPCRFKILPPKYTSEGDKKYVSFSIVVEKRHRYFINFPLLFKFYSDSKFRSLVKIFYSTEEADRQLLLNKEVEFISKIKEYTVYITDVIMGKIVIEVELEIDHGSPVIDFEILENSTCTLMKEHKIKIEFPEN